jgi:hypothetical protein
LLMQPLHLLTHIFYLNTELLFLHQLLLMPNLF